MIPTLDTERPVLREWRQDDFDAYAAFWTDAEPARHAGGACSREDLGWTTLISSIGLENGASMSVAGRLGARRDSVCVLRGTQGAIYRHPEPAFRN